MCRMNVPPGSREGLSSTPDILCLSHLRWEWVFQRPQHLFTRAARDRRVWFVEEAVVGHTTSPRLAFTHPHDNVTVVVPHLPHGLSDEEREVHSKELLDLLVQSKNLSNYVLWYYTPMALPFSRHLS